MFNVCIISNTCHFDVGIIRTLQFLDEMLHAVGINGPFHLPIITFDMSASYCLTFHENFTEYFGQIFENRPEYISANVSKLEDIPENSPVAIPFLEIIEQPAGLHDFRYGSDFKTTSHGCILGATSSINRKTFPTVALRNYNEDALVTICCSIYQIQTRNSQRMPHCHNLTTKIGKMRIFGSLDIVVSNENNYTATLKGISIVHAKKKKVALESAFFKRLCEEKECEENRQLLPDEICNFLKVAEKHSHNINFNQVCLRFEAYIKNESEDKLTRICDPIFSNVIENRKKCKKNLVRVGDPILPSDIKNRLKRASIRNFNILRMAPRFGSVYGKTEVIILTNLVDKRDLKIKFFASDGWEGFAKFKVEGHLGGITLETPKYHDVLIQSPVKVKVELYRPSDRSSSNFIDFEYTPN